MKTENEALVRLFHDNPENAPDLLYLSGFMAPDALTLLEVRGTKVLAVSPLEYGRAVKTAKVDRIVDTASILPAAKASFGDGLSPESLIILSLCKEYGVGRVEVPRVFPVALADELRRKGLELHPSASAQVNERLLKSESEVEHIRDAVRITEDALAMVRERLGAASVGKDGVLYWGGEVLTAERVHVWVETLCLEKGAVAHHPIVAGGDQACDPHERGSGPLRAGELIIVDLFPRSKSSHYWGDLTRTFFKGKPGMEQRKLVDAVRSAQMIALDRIADGVVAGDVHAEVESHFNSLGYRSEVSGGTYTGFFHGTGHGLGLDIHEAPRLGRNVPVVLRSGMVVTVEPGLYYPGVGGCRIEDDVVVRAGGCELLSHFDYDWILD